MIRRNIYILILLIILNSCATDNNDNSKNNDSVLNKSEKRCGDGVCDGPENIDTCLEDCALSSTTGSDEGPKEMGKISDTGAVLAQLFIDVQVSREGGVGTCGLIPWGVDNISGGDFSCQPPKYWYNYDLSATALQNLRIESSGNENWAIVGEKIGGGTYQSASASSDGQRICAPVSIAGNIFEMNASGNYKNSEITFTIEADPSEIATWECDQGKVYERETTLLLIDWATAMTGNYTDLFMTFNEENRVSLGVYQKIITTSVNPSPDNRDSVKLTMDFKCIQEDADGIYNSVPCPWEK